MTSNLSELAASTDRADLLLQAGRCCCGPFAEPREPWRHDGGTPGPRPAAPSP